MVVSRIDEQNMKNVECERMKIKYNFPNCFQNNLKKSELLISSPKSKLNVCFVLFCFFS